MDSNAKIKISQFKKLLKHKRNILLLGQSGYGKTQVIETYAKENNLNIAYLDLAGILPEAVAGIPVYTKDSNGYYKRMLDIEFKNFLECEGEGWLLLIDEINQGQPDALNTLYGMTHPNPAMRRWAGHRISKCQIVACGNLNDGRDGTVYLTELPTPLLNRFYVFELIPSKQDAFIYLKDKYTDLKFADKYIEVLLDNDIAPRDCDEVLNVIATDDDPLFIEAKIGEALATKLVDIKNNIKTIDPIQLFNNAKKIYHIYKENGKVSFGKKLITKEEDLLQEFKKLLSEEEITAIVKGSEPYV